MLVKPKAKYRRYAEPVARIGKAGYRNIGNGRGKASGNSGTHKAKHGAHVVGTSGRTLGRMVTAFDKGRK